jgi:predicted nucleotidyltransferase
MRTTPEEAALNAEQAIKEAAERLLPHGSLYLFGSRARGTADRRSDFDLAILPKAGFSQRELLEFAEALDQSPAIIYAIDLVDWEEASKELRERIHKEGILWKN